MAHHQGRFLTVVNGDKRLVGVVALADFGRAVDAAGQPLSRIPPNRPTRSDAERMPKLAALDVEALSQSSTAPLADTDIWKAAQGHVVGETELVGTYVRGSSGLRCCSEDLGRSVNTFCAK